jgi:hypothetical protein
MRPIEALRSIVASFRASAALGRASRLREQGECKLSLAAAKAGLAELNHAYVRRTNPLEGSSLASLTILCEELASQLCEAGASENDLRDSISFLKGIVDGPTPELCSSIPLLESRLAVIQGCRGA